MRKRLDARHTRGGSTKTKYTWEEQVELIREVGKVGKRTKTGSAKQNMTHEERNLQKKDRTA